jgi:gluconokinase
MIFIIMGVSGAGKSTVGKILANKLNCAFYDADDLHSHENIEKMRKGTPLTDADREFWLRSIRDLINGQKRTVVIACSALKRSYRDYLSVPEKEVVFIYLKGEPEILRQRLAGRKGHYAGPELLRSQIETLEEPENDLNFNITDEPGVIVESILCKFDL